MSRHQQPLLLQPKRPPTHERIDLRHARAEAVELAGDLAIADGPWTYRQQFGASGADEHYETITIDEVVAHLEAIKAPRLALWITWPVLAADWPESLPKWGRPVTGGAWLKSDAGDAGHYGQGYHWAGCSEPVLVYTRKDCGPLFTDRGQPLRNAWHEPPGAHSRKPVAWQAQWIRRWCPPGGRVVDPYAGLGAAAEATLEAGGGRTYRGTEADAERHLEALSLLAQWSPGL